MLFKQSTLDGIAAGKITLAFRRWQRPTVKAGGTLVTSAGLLAIDEVEEITGSKLTEADARCAGFTSLDALLVNLANQRDAPLYRIAFRRLGDDPRIELRQDDSLTNDALAKLVKQLDRLDSHSKLGPWTRKLLRLIADYPEQRAGDLAEISGYTKSWLKLNVRKLKNLGLTQSLNPGYRISPRGQEFLKRTGKKRPSE